jgi:hypothetical protein
VANWSVPDEIGRIQCGLDRQESRWETRQVRKRVVGLVITLGMLASVVVPADARVAVIVTAVTLADDSERALDAAVAEAIDTVARGARAMGLTHLKLKKVVIVEHTVVVGVLASDAPAPETTAPDESSSPGPDEAADALRPPSAPVVRPAF